MMAPPVGLGLIGLGWWGGVLTAAARASGAAEVVSCYARSPEARAGFAAEHGCRAAESLDALLADPGVDGVLIATPHSTHADLIERAAAAGRHVFVEKPMTLAVAEARRAIDAAERAGVVLQVGQNARRQPAVRRIKAMLEAGDLGTLLQLEGNRSGPAAHLPGLAPWRAEPAESPAGGMAAMGSHIVDTFHYLVGPARRVFAFSVDRLDVRPIDDATAVTIEYGSGPLGYIGTSYFVPAVNTVAAYGTDHRGLGLRRVGGVVRQRHGRRVPRPLFLRQRGLHGADGLGAGHTDLRDHGRPRHHRAHPPPGAPLARLDRWLRRRRGGGAGPVRRWREWRG
jgi:predicted dehydrogenase